MPIYEYRCPNCGAEEEALQSVGATPPKCKCGKPMTKLVSRTNFALKGRGWYSDHYGLKSAAAKS